MIYSVGGGPSGGKLAFLLGDSVFFPRGEKRFGLGWERNVIRDGQLSTNINYGVKKEHLPEHVNEWNCLNYHSENAQDKLFCFKKFDELGIPYPKIINPEEHYKNGSILGRKNFSSKGDGIVRYLKDSEKWREKQHDYFCEFIYVEAEARVHVFRGMVICEQRKDFGDNPHFIHNTKNGSKLFRSPINHPERWKILKACCDAVKAVGLDYGAVDILFEKETGRWLFAEVNSAPSFAAGTGYLYATRIAHHLNVGINVWWSFDKESNWIDNREHLMGYKDIFNFPIPKPKIEPVKPIVSTETKNEEIVLTKEDVVIKCVDEGVNDYRLVPNYGMFDRMCSFLQRKVFPKCVGVS